MTTATPAELRSEWDRICTRAPGSTFFHTPAWSEILVGTFPTWRMSPFTVELRSGNRCIVPFLEKWWSSPVCAYGESMLPGVYGGPLFERTPVEADWAALWARVGRMRDYLMHGNPFLASPFHPAAEVRECYTQVIPLQADFAAVRQGFSKSHKKDINGAIRNGLEVKVARAPAEVNAYYAAYSTALERWGKKASGFYPLSLFESMFRHPAYGKSIKLWVVYQGNELLGGNWVFYHHDHAVAWHGTVHAEYIHLNVTHLLTAVMLEDACGLGLRWFDFNPSGANSGVETFKTRFGAIPMSFPVYRNLGPGGKAFRVSRAVRQKLLRRCPM